MRPYAILTPTSVGLTSTNSGSTVQNWGPSLVGGIHVDGPYPADYQGPLVGTNSAAYSCGYYHGSALANGWFDANGSPQSAAINHVYYQNAGVPDNIYTYPYTVDNYMWGPLYWPSTLAAASVWLDYFTGMRDGGGTNWAGLEVFNLDDVGSVNFTNVFTTGTNYTDVLSSLRNYPYFSARVCLDAGPNPVWPDGQITRQAVATNFGYINELLTPTKGDDIGLGGVANGWAGGPDYPWDQSVAQYFTAMAFKHAVVDPMHAIFPNCRFAAPSFCQLQPDLPWNDGDTQVNPGHLSPNGTDYVWSPSQPVHYDHFGFYMPGPASNNGTVEWCPFGGSPVTSSGMGSGSPWAPPGATGRTNYLLEISDEGGTPLPNGVPDAYILGGGISCVELYPKRDYGAYYANSGNYPPIYDTPYGAAFSMTKFMRAMALKSFPLVFLCGRSWRGDWYKYDPACGDPTLGSIELTGGGCGNPADAMTINVTTQVDGTPIFTRPDLHYYPDLVTGITYGSQGYQGDNPTNALSVSILPAANDYWQEYAYHVILQSWHGCVLNFAIPLEDPYFTSTNGCGAGGVYARELTPGVGGIWYAQQVMAELQTVTDGYEPVSLVTTDIPLAADAANNGYFVTAVRLADGRILGRMTLNQGVTPPSSINIGGTNFTIGALPCTNGFGLWFGTQFEPLELSELTADQWGYMSIDQFANMGV